MPPCARPQAARTVSLHLEALPPSPPSAAPRPVLPADDNAIVFTEAEMQALERTNIANALQRCHGKIYGEDGAAALLGISPTTLCSRIKVRPPQTGRLIRAGRHAAPGSPAAPALTDQPVLPCPLQHRRMAAHLRTVLTVPEPRALYPSPFQRFFVKITPRA